MSDNGLLRRLQLAELEILIELDRVCRENNITYVLDAGTCLGAVRHKGFIPWDDDIDVRMSRTEFEQFCEVCKTRLDTDRFFLQSYDTDPGYRWGFARVLRNNTEYLRDNQRGSTYKTGIFLDIFPVDPYPDKGFSRWYVKRLSWLARKGLYSTVGKNVARSWWRRLGFHILSVFPKKSFTNILEYLCKKYKDYPTSLVRCYGWSEPAEEAGFNKEWFSEICELEFEGLKFFAPKDYHGFLVRSFGEDYMTPPPEKDRVQRHLAAKIKFPS